MSMRAFIIVMAAVGLLLAAGIYVHMPRAGSAAAHSLVHGTR